MFHTHAMEHDWIRSRLKEVKKTQAGLARHLDVAPARINEIIDGNRTVKPHEAVGIADYLDLPQSEVSRRLYGSDMLPGEAETTKPAPTPTQKLRGVPEVDIRAGMGGGGLASYHYEPDSNGGMTAADDVRAEWGLPDDYLRAELRVSPNQVRIIEVQGDSMEPTLRSGERVMVDLADTRPSPPGIFALWDGFGVVVKRLEHIPNSDPAALRISSDNTFHKEYERTAEEVRIIGRVVWAARRL